MMSRWDGFDEFVAIANSGTFSGAARSLGLSTSHISRAISRLEERLQAQLFFRTTRRVTLTETGRALLEPCRQIIEDREEALAMVVEGGEPQGELRLTCSTTLGQRFVAPIARQFAMDFPKVQVSIDLTNRLVDLIAEGFDLAIRTGSLADSRLVATRIASRQLYTCASPDYLARNGRPMHITALAHHECLIGTATTWHFQVEQQEQHFRPQGRWRCNSGTAIVEAAIAGMGLCQLPEFYVLPHLASGELQTVLDDVRIGNEPIWAVYPQRRHLLPKVRLLVDRLREQLGSDLVAKQEAP